MTALRAFFREHMGLAAVLVALALMMRAIVPAGYMASTTAQHITIQICADTSAQQLTRTIDIPSGHQAEGKDGAMAKAGGHCAFGALSAPGLEEAGAAVLAIALAAMLCLGLAPSLAPTPFRRQMRPPLRGPPAGR